MTARPALAVSLYVQDRPVLLVGDGPGADERARRLQAARADLVRAGEAGWREYQQQTFFAVFAHSDSDALNKEVAEWARAQGSWAYAHDQPALSDFSFPALVRRGPLQVAISTDGESPALAARLRHELQDLLDASGAALDRTLDELQRVRTSFPRGPDRMKMLKSLAAKVRLVGKIETDSDTNAEAMPRK